MLTKLALNSFPSESSGLIHHQLQKKKKNKLFIKVSKTKLKYFLNFKCKYLVHTLHLRIFFIEKEKYIQPGIFFQFHTYL